MREHGLDSGASIPRQLLRRVVWTLAIAAAMGSGTGCAASSTSTTGGPGSTTAAGMEQGLHPTAVTIPPGSRLNVVTTVSPITSIVHNVGGGWIELRGLVPEGTNSHTYEPSPSDAQTLSAADVIFANGLQLEIPTLALAAANMPPSAEIVRLGDLTIRPQDYVFDFSFPEARGAPNPHLWPNPAYALQYAEIVRRTLSARDPAHAANFRTNFEAFRARIEELDRLAHAVIATIPPENRKLLTYHDSWAYFAPVYGLTIVGAIQPADFSEPSARDVAALIRQIRAERVPAIFGSEVFTSPVLEQIAREAGARYVDSLRDDDLPGKPGDPNHSYFGLMAENLRTMAEALGGDPSLVASFDPSNVAGSDAAVEQSP